MTIQTFSSYLQRLEETASRNEMTEILSDLFKKADPGEIDKICYLSLGRLVPKFESVEFQMSGKSMIKVIAKAFQTDLDTVTSDFKEMGDLGSVAGKYSKLSKKDSKKLGKQSITDIYNMLLQIAKEEGTGSVERKINGLSQLIKSLDPLSAKFVSRIPIGTLRLGFSDMTIIDSLSWMSTGDKSLRKQIEHAYNVSADIGLIAKQFKKGGISAISHLKATPGIPIRPQQAERLGTSKEMISKIGTAAVEWKLDGFRAQVHIINPKSQISSKKTQLQLGGKQSDREVQIFSRSLESTTHMFPEIVEEFENLQVDSAILDGEAIGYDPKTGKHLPFQETIQRKRKHGITEMKRKIPLRYYAFDILSLNGYSLLTKPFNERRKKLEELFKEQGKKMSKKTVDLADQIVTNKPKDLDNQFNLSVKKGYEGIMVKKHDAVYQAGARNYNWVKFKHHGEGKLSDTLDCLVLGYFKGQGKRSGFGIGAFLVGVRKDNTFVTVAKVGTGLTDKQWVQLKTKCQKSNVKIQPNNYIVPKALFPDVWVTPSIVVEIAADEITKSPLHTAKLALRFPRLMKFRDDKSPQEVTTTKEVEKIFDLQFVS